MEGIQPGFAVTPTIRLVRCLGVGGMGSVWVADHLALRTQVVVKFMSTDLATSADALERFSREAAAAAQVKSPHVVQMLDHGVTPQGVPFIAMELLEGRDLSKHLLERGRLSIVETAELVQQIGKALGRAHERGIVHRDIKPENIFLCDIGGSELFVKLLDFGIAKSGGPNSLSNGTRTGAMIGTPYYMSPEQMMGSKQLDPRTDLWALGVVVYQCVTGQRPFDAETFGALAVMIHSGPLPQPTLVDPTIPRAFDEWFARACARSPEARFASAKELADALTAVARGEPWVPRPTTGAAAPQTFVRSDPNRPSTHAGFVSAQRPPAKAPLAAIGAGAAVVVLALGGGAVWLATRPAAPPRSAAATAASLAPAPPAQALPPPSAAATASVGPDDMATATPSAASAASAAPAVADSASAAPSTPAPRPAAVQPGGKRVVPAVPPPKSTQSPPPSKHEKDIF